VLKEPGVDIGSCEFLPLRQSWRSKAFYADAAAYSSRKAIRSLAGRHLFNNNGRNKWIVWNPSKKKQAGIVEFYVGRDQGKLKTVITSEGTPLRFEENGFHRYLVEIPILKPDEIICLDYELIVDVDLSEAPTPALTPFPRLWENQFFTLEFADNAAIELFAGKEGDIFYNRNQAVFGFLEPVLELPQDYKLSWDSAGMQPVKQCRYPSIEWKSYGMLSHGIISDVMERNGCFCDGRSFSIRWRLYHDLPRIDVELALSKPETLELESIYLAAPFIDIAEKWILHTADSDIDLARNLLPGAMLDSFYAHRGITCLTSQRSWSMFSPDAPVVHPGSIKHFQWLMERDFKTETTGFYWQIYHNMLITDSPAFQQINDKFTFTLLLNSRGPIENLQSFVV